MPQNFRISDPDIVLDAIVDSLDTGGTNAVIEFYDGSQPAQADNSIGAATLLVTLDLQNPAFGAATIPNLTALATPIGLPISSNAAVAAGTIAWFRLKGADGTTAFDGTVGIGDLYTFDIVLSSLEVAIGDFVKLTSFTVAQPNGPPMGRLIQTLMAVTQINTATYVGRNGPIAQTLPVITQSVTCTFVE